MHTACCMHVKGLCVCVFRWVSISTEYLQASQKQYYSVGILLQLLQLLHLPPAPRSDCTHIPDAFRQGWEVSRTNAEKNQSKPDSPSTIPLSNAGRVDR